MRASVRGVGRDGRPAVPPPPPGAAQAFASDNTAPMAPEALAALVAADGCGCVASYGEDAEVTREAVAAVRAAFGAEQAAVHFVSSGTVANSLCLAAVCDSYHSVFCHREAHLEKDEASAPGLFRPGLKLHLLDGEAGKIDLRGAEAVLRDNRGVHSAQPRAISLTQSTELGAVYTPAEVARAGEFARRHGLLVHMDGARFANAVAALGCAPADVTWRAGVDLLSLGGSKNGTGFGEAVVVFDPARAPGLPHRLKQAGQLHSKARYLAAPWLGSLRDGAWLQRAAAANAAARRLAAGLEAVGLRLHAPCEANGVFVHLPPVAAAALEEAGWHFYRFLGDDVYRFMCSWRSTAEEVDALLAAVRAALAPA